MQNKNCDQHQQPIVGFTQNLTQRKGLCWVCLAQQTSDFVFTEEANQQIASFSKWFTDQFDALNKRYVLNLKSVIQKIYDIKTSLNSQIEKLICNIQDWITETSKQRIKSLNFDEFIIQVNDYWNSKEKQFKWHIVEQLGNLESNLQIIQEIKNQSLSITLDEHTLNSLYKNQNQIFPEQKKSQMNLNIKCEQDDQQIIMMDINKDRPINERLLCVDCISRDYGRKYISIEKGQKIWTERETLKKFELKHYLNQETQLIEQSKKIFEAVRNQFTQTIDNTIQIINYEHQGIIDIINSKQKELGQDWQILTKEEIQNIAQMLSLTVSANDIQSEISLNCYRQESKILEVTNDSIAKLRELQQTSFNQIIRLFKQKENQVLQVTEKKQNNIDKPNYKLQVTQLHNVQCYCLGLNQDKNILVVGSNYNIKIFQIENGKLAEIQLLEQQAAQAFALCLGKNNTIFSCCSDNTIKIWAQSSRTEWKLVQELNEHSQQVMCLVVNKAEDLLITGSMDTQIICWIKTQNEWKQYQTLQNHSSYVIALSFNQSETYLLSCQYDKFNIFKCDSEKRWTRTQTITADDFVYRASFIGDNMIAFSLSVKGILRIYEKKQSKFRKKQDIEIAGSEGCYYFFPLAFCKQKGILVVKNSQYVNILIKKQDNSFEVHQTIEFLTKDLYGTISEDGQYLVTWDQDSREIQLRQLL